MKRTVAALAAAAMLAAMAGCSDSPDDNSAADNTPSAQAPSTATLTLAQACASLTGGTGLVATALQGAGLTEATRSSTQTGLFTIVSGGPASLQGPAGQLVDFLDDPGAYTDGGQLSSTVTDAAAALTGACS